MQSGWVAQPVSTFSPATRSALAKVPPERLPRRAVRGLGAHSHHQTGPFLPTHSFDEPDINLPDGDGWELKQELENLRPHYAIAISGYGMKADCERSAQSGFRLHLVKPVLPHNLDTLLKEATIELKEKE
jgi:hypothetical protein